MFVRKRQVNREPRPAASLDLIYQAVAQRRLQHDLLMWQVPALGLTAQAFLLTIVLGPGSGRLARILAALLAALSSGLSMQLMARHRWHEATERAWLEAFEREHRLDPVHRGQYELASDVGVRPANRFASWRSYRTWQVGLAIFGLVSLLGLAPRPFQDHFLLLRHVSWQVLRCDHDRRAGRGEVTKLR